MYSDSLQRHQGTIVGRLERLIATPKSSGDVSRDVWKYSIYNRWSMHLMLFIFGFFGLAIVETRVRDDQDVIIASSPLVVAGLAVFIMVAISVAVLELEPQLNTESRKPLAPILGIAMIIMAVAWMSGLAVKILGHSIDMEFLGVALSYSALTLASCSIFPWLKYSWVWVIGFLTVTVTLVHPVIGWHVFLTIIAIPMMRLFTWTFVVVNTLQRARDSEATLQVTEERLRFAQQLHDTLGQHLAALSLKAQVAQALSARGDVRLDEELKQIQELTRQSTNHMRQVVRGYRSINLVTELKGAVELFHSAGIHVDVEGTSAEIPEKFRPVCAWLVRETATNVLRHSSATLVRIELSDKHLLIRNDGAAESIRILGGLETLRQQAEQVGAQLQASTQKLGGSNIFDTECRFAFTGSH